jgi:hypothetical protein
MLSGGPAAECGERAFQSSMEMMLSRLSEVELEQSVTAGPMYVQVDLSGGCRARRVDVLRRCVTWICLNSKLFMRLPV